MVARRSLLAAALSLVPLASACSSTPAPQADPVSELQAFSYSTNLITTSVQVNGQTAMAFVDTGNPFFLLDPATFTSVANLSPSVGGDISSLLIGSEQVANVHVYPFSMGLTSPDPDFPIAGNVGCAGICGKVATFDYRDATFALGSAAPPPPAGLEAESVIDFDFEGGDPASGEPLPKSRIVVTVSLEANDYTMILDTGASAVTVSQRAYDALTMDGRAQLGGGTVETTSGQSTSSLTRAASVVVSGVEVDGVAVSHDSSFDKNLAAIGTDVGTTIDGSLGGTFLHLFYLTIDYPAQKVHLARYSDLDFAIDPAERIGIDMQQETKGGAFMVMGVSSAVAALGVGAGDTIVAIDGLELSALEESQVTVLAFGKVGTTRLVTFGPGGPSSGKTIAVPVEEFLPLPGM